MLPRRHSVYRYAASTAEFPNQPQTDLPRRTPPLSMHPYAIQWHSSGKPFACLIPTCSTDDIARSNGILFASRFPFRPLIHLQTVLQCHDDQLSPSVALYRNHKPRCIAHRSPQDFLHSSHSPPRLSESRLVYPVTTTSNRFRWAIMQPFTNPKPPRDRPRKR